MTRKPPDLQLESANQSPCRHKNLGLYMHLQRRSSIDTRRGKIDKFMNDCRVSTLSSSFIRSRKGERLRFMIYSWDFFLLLCLFPVHCDHFMANKISSQIAEQNTRTAIFSFKQ